MSTPTTDSPDPIPTRALCACGHEVSEHSDLRGGCGAPMDDDAEYAVCPCDRKPREAALTARIAALEAALRGYVREHSDNIILLTGCHCDLCEQARALLGGAS